MLKLVLLLLVLVVDTLLVLLLLDKLMLGKELPVLVLTFSYE